MSSSLDLSQSSLKDLLKLCRAHAIRLPEVLPKDKLFYVDLIVRHREAAGMDQMDAMGQGAGASAAAAAAAAASAASSSSLWQREGEVSSSSLDADDFVQVGRDESLSSSVSSMASAAAAAAHMSYPELRARAGSRASAAAASAASFVSAVAAAASSASSSIAAAMPAAAKAAAPSDVSAAPASYADAVAAAIPAVAHEGKEALEASHEGGAASAAAASAADGDDVDYADEADDADAEFIRSPFVQKITSILQNIAVFDYLERHTSIQRFYWLVLLILLASTSIFLYVGVLAVFNFICFVYPAYQTYKTLEGKYLPGAMFDGIDQDHSIEVHKYWLTYWCVYGLFQLVEFAADYTLYWLPYYDPSKVIFLVWCFHPSSQGCALVYRWVIRPLFLPREESIDRAIARFNDSVSQAFVEVRAIIVKNVAKRIAGTDDTPKKSREAARAH